MDFIPGQDCSGAYGKIDRTQPAVTAFDSGQRPQGRAAPEVQIRLDIPYPEVCIHCPNTGYARSLQNVYAGTISEFTAISQYFYQHILQKSSCPEAAQVLMGISMVEMHHLELLAACIQQLGGNPVFAASGKGQRQWWTGAMVPYQRGLRMMLLEDIESERAAIREYRRLMACIHNEDIQALIGRIVMDEEHHIQLFCWLLEKYCNFHR